MTNEIPGMAKYHAKQMRRAMEQAGFVYYATNWFAKGGQEDGDGLIHISGAYVDENGDERMARWAEEE